MWLREKGRVKPWVKEKGVGGRNPAAQSWLGGCGWTLENLPSSSLGQVVNNAVSSLSQWDGCPWAARSGQWPTGILDTIRKQ